MSYLLHVLRVFLLVGASGGLGSCAAPGGGGSFTPRQYAQSMDSASSACMRTPACYAPPSGEAPILPWVSRSVEAASAASALMKLLEAADLARVVQVLSDCANQADQEVNERLLGQGQYPSSQLCQETFKTEPGGRKVTWAMHLGQEKHRAAMECVQRELPEDLWEHVRLQQSYRYDRNTRALEPLDSHQVDTWLREGLFHKLLGTLIPDVVIHAAGNVLKVQAIFDFKFTCPLGNRPSWHKYHKNHPFHPATQQEMYKEAFNAEVMSVRPGFGATP